MSNGSNKLLIHTSVWQDGNGTHTAEDLKKWLRMFCTLLIL